MAATPVWVPDEKTVARSRLGDFLAATGCVDQHALDLRAREDPAWFWGEAARWLALDWQREPDSVVEGLDEPGRELG